MSVRNLNRLAWVIAVGAGLGPAIACSKEEPPAASPMSATPSETFRFAPPDGTEYVRTDRRSEEVAIVGVPLRRVDDEELRWQVAVARKGSDYRVKQDLVYISLARDGQTLAKGKVREGISAELVIDQNGNLTDVQGLDKTADTLQSLAAPGQEAAAEQLITPEALAYIVASRYKLMFGDTIGRPATPGATWTINGPAGSFVASRTVTVTGQEKCDNATCARLQVDFKLDPRVVADRAVKLVKERVLAAGGDPSKVTLRQASYGMSGSMLIESATMLSHGAMLAESGTVTVADPTGAELAVAIKGTTELSYSYSKVPEAAGPRPQPKPRVAAE